MIDARWEHGSDLHWMEPSSTATYPWTDAHVLYGCGRFALAALVRMGRWQRLWIPSFFCQEVVAAIPRDHVELLVYPDSPTDLVEDLTHLAVRDGDAILVVNLLGLRAGPPSTPPGIPVIEDHTHDLGSAWAMRSRAAFCVASLRKVLPVPDGGIVWSPVGEPLPPEPAVDLAHAQAAFDRLSGMVLKTAYLDGGAVEKSAFRARYVAGEQAISQGPISGILPVTRAALPGFPVERWRAERIANFAAFRTALGAVAGVRIVLPADDAVSYAVTLCFDTADLRDAVRARLLDARIYPAVLWALDTAVVELPGRDHDLSCRILSLHCDQRYTAADMQRVASVVSAALA